MNEPLLSLPAAQKFIKRQTGRAVDHSTIWRWAIKGLRGVKLEHVRYGREMFVTEAGIARFTERLAAAYAGPLNTSTMAINTAAHDRAEAELDAAGV